MLILDRPVVPLECEMNPKVEKAVNSLENLFNHVKAVRVFNNKINVLGYRDLGFIFKSPICYDILMDMNGKIIEKDQFVFIEEGSLTLDKIVAIGSRKKKSDIRKGIRKTKDYKDKIMEIKDQNRDNIKEAISSIKLFKHKIGEVEKLLKRPLKLTRTGCPEAYIEARNKFELMVEAYIIGADHIVEWKPDLVEGIPVRYADK